MDVTPTHKMFEVMEKMTDGICGEEPGPFERSPAAEQRRTNRKLLMDVFHQLVALSMREGAARAFNPNRTELGSAIQQGAFRV